MISWYTHKLDILRKKLLSLSINRKGSLAFELKIRSLIFKYEEELEFHQDCFVENFDGSVDYDYVPDINDVIDYISLFKVRIKDKVYNFSDS